MRTLFSDLRWGLRLLFKNPGFTSAAVLSLSIGIGVTTLVFTFSSSAFLRTIPIPDLDRFVAVHGARPTFFEYVALRDAVNSQLDLVACLRGSDFFTAGSDSGFVRTLTVSNNYFRAVAAKPAAGPFPRADSDQPTVDTCVISHPLWISRFGGSHAAIGQVIRLRNRNMTITAVGPPDFRGTDLIPVDIWLPVSSSEKNSEKLQWELLGRLQPGVPVLQARAALEEGYRALGIGAPEIGGKPTIGIQSIGERQRLLYAPVTFFTGLGFLVLLVGCANVAGLLSTRSIERRTEIAVRLALGSRRSGLVRLLLTETALLAIVSSALGLLATWGFIAAVKPWLPPDLLGVSFDQVAINARVLTGTIVLACIVTLVSGLLPAWRASRTDLISAMKGNAFVGGAFNSRVSMRKMLVVLQLAVSFAFICIGTLFIRSMALRPTSELQSDRLIVVNMFDLDVRQTNRQPKLIHRLVQDALRAVPGVEDVTIASSPPLATFHTASVRLTEDDSRAAIGGTTVISGLSNYFKTSGTTLVRGRTYYDQAQSEAGCEVVISEAAARRFWPNRDPLGCSVILGDGNRSACTVVGIARDIKATAVSLYDRPPDPVIYVPAYSGFVDANAVCFALVKTQGPATSFLPRIQGVFLEQPSLVENTECQTFENYLSFLFRPQKIGAAFALVLGLLAGLLAAFGLYSVTSSMVAARTREIGIRIALGATVGQTVRLFVGQGARLSLSGIALGVPLALGAARILRSGMFGIIPVQVSTLIVSALAVVSATLAASYLPARRAAKVDPIAALRTE